MEINLISDTTTKPCKKMLASMLEAKVGDDVFKEDPTVNKLEKKSRKNIWYGFCIVFSIWNYD